MIKNNIWHSKDKRPKNNEIIINEHYEVGTCKGDYIEIIAEDELVLISFNAFINGHYRTGKWARIIDFEFLEQQLQAKEKEIKELKDKLKDYAEWEKAGLAKLRKVNKSLQTKLQQANEKLNKSRDYLIEYGDLLEADSSKDELEIIDKFINELNETLKIINNE